MDIEKLKESVHPDANRNLTNFQVTAWYLCIFFPFFIFMISAGITLFIYFINVDNPSLDISNIGFGMLIALSSVCFSYFQILQLGNYKKLHLDVQKSGELFLISSVAFIISSALKYSWTVIKLNSYMPHWFGFPIRIFFIVSFLTAEVICMVGLAKLIDVLHIKITTSRR